MKYWFDTEFIEDGVTIDLLSIGIVREDGDWYYAECRDTDRAKAGPWVREHVIPLLHHEDFGFSKEGIADDLRNFVEPGAEIWAYYGDYDWVVLCQLFGTMMDLPEGWPMFAMDVKQLCVTLGNPRLPEQRTREHNALNDAMWTKDAYQFLSALLERQEGK